MFGVMRAARVIWAVLAVLALLLALGPATPLHGLFYQWAPGMAQLRAPARLGSLVPRSASSLPS